MAQTSWGFDGTINEAQWSEMAGLLGNGYVAADSASCVVTAVPGARSVSVSAGTLYGDGIVTVLDAAETVALTTPVNGQWYVIALRRTWASNTTALVAIAGATTTTSTPTAPPSTLPTLNSDPGVLTDQPISWAWCNSANTTVVVYDMRQFPVRRMPLTVANNVVRDGIFQTPTQGQEVWRNDLGAVETYYGAYNAISNPGGRDVAGWYTTDRAGGLVPIRPTVVTIASGSGTSNSLGYVTFSAASSISLDGIFTSNFANYKVLLSVGASISNGTSIMFRMRTGGTTLSTGAYNWTRNMLTLDTFNNGGVYADTAYQAGIMGNSQGTSIAYDIFRPAQVNRTTMRGSGFSGFNGNTVIHTAAHVDALTAHDGLNISWGGGTVSGDVQVFGYND